MVLDQVENFIRVSVAGGHASGDNTISLQSGEASFLPDVNQGKYNLTWWDSENFSLPSEDPNVEIVRVNSIDTTNDTISVTRGQENTSATSKSTGDGEYSLILSPTAKTIEDIDANKLDASAYSPEADTHTRYSDSEAVTAVNNTTDSLTAPAYTHDTNITTDLSIPSGRATLFSGPIIGSGSISGNGRIQSSHKDNFTTTTPLFVASGVNESDINDGRDIDWIDESVNNYDYTFDGRTVTINISGVYEITSDIDFESTGQSRANPNIFIQRNSSIVGVGGRSGYMRDAEGHNHSSIHASFIGQLSAGDKISVTTSQDADGGTVTPERGQFYIKKLA